MEELSPRQIFPSRSEDQSLWLARQRQSRRESVLDEVDLAQMSLFDTVKDDDVLKELKELGISSMTPIDAMNTLYQLQNKLKNRW